MENLIIRRPLLEDIDKLSYFFKIVITDTFQKEGIADMTEDMEEEIESKNRFVRSDLNSGGEERYFLLAIADDNIIGTIEFGQPNELILAATKGALEKTHEVGTIFVHPDFQGQGLGNRLLREMYATLLKNGIEEICLDSGYKHAQEIWKHKFGEPDYLLENYWGNGAHHMIWGLRVAELVQEDM